MTVRDQMLYTPGKDLEMREAMPRIENAIDRLPRDYREAITLHKLRLEPRRDRRAHAAQPRLPRHLTAGPARRRDHVN